MKNKNGHNNQMLYFLALFVPFVTVVLSMVLSYGKPNFYSLVPVWNDEIGWWGQVASILKYGGPLGYTGYNGTHATIGTFGPWGIAPLLPYALFGKIFGWELHSMAIANIVFLSVAFFIFVWLSQPSNNQFIWMIVIYFCSFITIGYSYTSMADPLHYSLAMVLAGIIIWLNRYTTECKFKKTRKNAIYVVSISMILVYAVLTYILFSFFIPIFLWLIFRKWNWKTRVGISGIIFIVMTCMCYYIVGLCSSPYPESTIGDILSVINKNGILIGIVYTIRNAIVNLSTIDFFNLTRLEKILSWYFLLYLVMCVLALVLLIKERSLMASLPAIYLLVFLLGYCALYTASPWTLCRGTNTGLLIALLTSCCFNYEKNSVGRVVPHVALGITVLSIASITNYYSDLYKERQSIFFHKEELTRETHVLSEIIDISPEYAAWENTYAIYGDVDYMYLSIPIGAAWNYYLSNEMNTTAKYVITRNKEIAEEIQRRFDNHEMIFEDEYFIIYKKK